MRVPRWAVRLRRRRNGPKVFGIGLNKTGTTTLGVCLRTLGYAHTSYDEALLRAAVREDLDPVFVTADRYDSFEDWPWPLVYRELGRRYPGSRFILTTRLDASTWLESLLAHADRTPRSEARKLVYGHASPRGHEAEHIAYYERHNRQVMDHFAGDPDRLLTVCWERGDGWPELCAFLGAEVPDLPFPHANRGPAASSAKRCAQ